MKKEGEKKANEDSMKSLLKMTDFFWKEEQKERKGRSSSSKRIRDIGREFMSKTDKVLNLWKKYIKELMASQDENEAVKSFQPYKRVKNRKIGQVNIRMDA